MTKEELISNAIWNDDNTCIICISDLETFFESNVVIPKGTNRHPYADVLHEWVEDDSLLQILTHGGGIIESGVTASKMFSMVYRIKPSEPVYEWQWAIFDYDRIKRTEKFYSTKKELAKDYDSVPLSYWQSAMIIEETKRVRQ